MRKVKNINYVFGKRASGKEHAMLEYLRKKSWSCRNVLSNEMYNLLYKEEKK